MPLMRSGYQALVNAVWGLVSGGLSVASRTVTTVAGTVDTVGRVVWADQIGTVTGNVNGGVVGNVNGNLGGSVLGYVAGNVNGHVLGNLGGNVNGSITGSMGGNVYGSVGAVLGSVNSVVLPVTVAGGSPGTIRRKLKGATVITDQNTAQTAALGVSVVEALTQLRFLGSTRTGDTLTDHVSIELLDAGNVRVYRSGINNQTTVRWELTEYWG
jgi:hypothetical protein